MPKAQELSGIKGEGCPDIDCTGMKHKIVVEMGFSLHMTCAKVTYPSGERYHQDPDNFLRDPTGCHARQLPPGGGRKSPLLSVIQQRPTQNILLFKLRGDNSTEPGTMACSSQLHSSAPTDCGASAKRRGDSGESGGLERRGSCRTPTHTAVNRGGTARWVPGQSVAPV